ncbi:MAG: ROK family protein [Rhodospirillales bacterium]|nr:MAG: ROK family protein [Rhodospirillales bacterium]
MRIGIDLGGSKIEIALLSPDGDVVFRRRTETPRNYPAVLDAIASLVRQAMAEAGASCSIGVGIPGTVSPATDLVKNANSTWLNGMPFAQDLSNVLGQNVRIANDANCFALSEAADGSGAGASAVFGVILGTGVGGGLVINGALHTGINAIAGEWGHNPLPWPAPDEYPGPPCWCGRNGCIETYLSGPGLRRDHEAGTSQRLDPATLVARAADGDAECMASFARYEERLARALAHVINLFDPDVVVLGGGMSNIDRLYETIPSMWDRWIFSDRVATRLLPPQHGDSSGVRGAAWLWPTEGEA